jgi:hypothetical protein
MRIFKLGIPFVAGAVLAFAGAGCAPVPYYEEVVVYVPVPVPDPCPPAYRPVRPAPPIIVHSESTPRATPIDHHQNTLVPASRTRETQASRQPSMAPAPEASRTKQEHAERRPDQTAAPDRDDERSSVAARTRAR